MVSQKNVMTLGAVALVVIAGVFVAPYLGITAKSGLAGALPQSNVVSTSGTCPLNGLTNLQFKPTFIDSSNAGTQTVVNTTVSVYANGDNTLLVSSTTGTTGYTTIGTANCGQAITAFIGDGGATYYYVEKSLAATDTNGANTLVSVALKKQSAATMTFSNLSSFGQSTIEISGVGNGSTNSDVSLNIKAGQEYYGDGGIEVCAVYSLSNISKVSFGSTTQPSALDPTVTIAAGKTGSCYTLNQQLYNYNNIQLPVVIQAKSGVVPSVSNISITVNDLSAYIKNGKAIQGYWNLDTNADIGAAAVSTSVAIQVN